MFYGHSPLPYQKKPNSMNHKIRLIFNGFSNSKIRALSIPHLWRAMIAIWFSLSVHSFVTAQTRLEYFGALVVYMSTVSNFKITFGCFEFVSRKIRVYTFIIIYVGSNIYIKNVTIQAWLFCLNMCLVYRGDQEFTIIGNHWIG